MKNSLRSLIPCHQSGHLKLKAFFIAARADCCDIVIEVLATLTILIDAKGVLEDLELFGIHGYR